MCTLKTQDEVIPYAKKLQEEGARNVLISMAGEGAVFISEKGDILKSPAPKGKVVNSVGAGDSMVAGFVTGMLETGDYKAAFRMGLCTGSASAFSPDLATRPEVEDLLAKFRGLKSIDKRLEHLIYIPFRVRLNVIVTVIIVTFVSQVHHLFL